LKVAAVSLYSVRNKERLVVVLKPAQSVARSWMRFVPGFRGRLETTNLPSG